MNKLEKIKKVSAKLTKLGNKAPLELMIEQDSLLRSLNPQELQEYCEWLQEGEAS